MYAKGKGSTVPSDGQAREKLALYVYEYLLHVGAQKAAQTFLSEIRWEKNITLGEPPGFLHSWWCVFWDLYCAAPERRDTCEHSSEAKAFHDYGFVNSGYGVNGIAHNAGAAPSPLGQMPPNDGMPGGPMPPGFFPNNSTMRPSPPTHPSSQPSPQHPQPPPPPHSQMMSTQFMGPRYPAGPRPSVRMPQMANDFNGPPGQPMMPNNMDPSRQGEAGEFVGWQGPPGMNPMNPRMNPPRGPGMGPMGPGSYGPSMRGPPPNSSLGPGGPGGPGMPPMSMAGPGGRPQWQPNTSTDFSMGGGPEGGPMGPIGPNTMGPVLNGDGMDGMKNSPANGGPGTPREDSGSGMGDYNLGGFGGPGENDQTESAAILKIKESMQEEAKRFEKDSDHPDYFMQ
ncbi:single-stranded DNA-binding protein 3 isoform X8 [Diprion similis]|uniref:single-stranded DNA-binding protein 3 isoform X8 n=1 Tax=Diprion similis TaxID=362088 RepID=UPI001EF94ABC|nr:single-stranded DNA-binding protein 3 isoform X8 [Diprion similis]